MHSKSESSLRFCLTSHNYFPTRNNLRFGTRAFRALGLTHRCPLLMNMPFRAVSQAPVLLPNPVRQSVFLKQDPAPWTLVRVVPGLYAVHGGNGTRRFKLQPAEPLYSPRGKAVQGLLKIGRRSGVMPRKPAGQWPQSYVFPGRAQR
jgi:hypothetical protein